MRRTILLFMLLSVIQHAPAQDTGSAKDTAIAEWAIELSSIIDNVDFLSNYQRGYAVDPNMLVSINLHTTTAFSAQAAFEYHSYRRTDENYNNQMMLLTVSGSLILFKTLVLGSGFYYFKSKERREYPKDPIVRGFYDGGPRRGAYYLAGLRVMIPIINDIYIPIGYYFVIGPTPGGSWRYDGLRLGFGKKF